MHASLYVRFLTRSQVMKAGVMRAWKMRLHAEVYLCTVLTLQEFVDRNYMLIGCVTGRLLLWCYRTACLSPLFIWAATKPNMELEHSATMNMQT